MSLIKADTLIAAVLCCATAFNVVEHYRGSAAPAGRKLMTVGDTFPKTDYVGSFGAPVQSAKEKTRVFYFFAPSCPWCKANLDNLKFLITNLPAQFQIVGLAVEDSDLEDYIRRSSLDLPISVIGLGDPLIRKLGGTPTTLVVGSNGKVEKVWHGAYGGAGKKEIESFLNLRLPVDAVALAKKIRAEKEASE